MNDFSSVMTGSSDSPEIGAGVYKVLRVGANDLAFPQQKDKLAEIIDFASGFEDGLYMMKMAMTKKPSDMSPIDFIHEYISIQKDHVSTTKRLAQLKKELARYE